MQKGWMNKEGGESNPASNNGMHPTANSVAFIRKTLFLSRLVAAGDAERWASSLDES